ncbi:MAG: hypothetical protein JXB26_07370 [Candidatus Aminicenantes bacterium]|nr:hypothetical protein [Candidatus Aminicenantes bacterium]
MIAFSILASLAVYAIIVEIIKARFQPFSGYVPLQNPFLIRYILYAAAATQVIIIRILRGVFLRKNRQQDPEKLLGNLFRTSLITLALCEVPALIGLVLFFLGGFTKDFYILLFISLILMFMFFPRKNTWESWLNYHSSSPGSTTRCL